ncbi:hypothetical protein PATSB16_08060 [Pandoraea thiooxydans]|uniref:Anti-sigma K factor RskA C-terminal domain-containing protein n=1 Tax=Pandoraea thiooxydans TaxID=445709 RepID=A0A0G3EJR6_9BURK|nr:anti-sigma factor [Pandoraea thiooxydans]AKJ67180.1 hypothetical protein ABW99_01980 [Pandoraea thiooxydans]APR94148.1 hypothetical protein PATSB16_08060 [Pandoraea thiooxydans]
MNPAHHPDLLDRLAAEYALGTLRGGARRRLETLAQRDQTVRRALLDWQDRLAALPELIPPHAPGAHVWHGVRRQLALEGVPPAAPAVSAVPLWSRLDFWRKWALAASLATVIAVVFAVRSLLPGLSPAQAPRYVAVLNDNQAHAGMLVSWNPAQRTLVLERLANYPLKPNQSLQLWGLPSGGRPHSLGVLPEQGPLVLRLAQAPQFPALAISVEPLGGSPDPNGPTGPVIYHGAVLPAT